MNTLVLTDPVIQRAHRPAQRDHANSALGCVLDAEIEALKARLQRGFANAAVGPARADLDSRVGWLRDSLARLQARRSALC
jgi:uncharacterized small protein (DUF1192 family)